MMCYSPSSPITLAFACAVVLFVTAIACYLRPLHQQPDNNGTEYNHSSNNNQNSSPAGRPQLEQENTSSSRR